MVKPAALNIPLFSPELWATVTSLPVIITLDSTTSTAACAVFAAFCAVTAFPSAVDAAEFAVLAVDWAELAAVSSVNPLSLFKSDISISPGFPIVILPATLNELPFQWIKLPFSAPTKNS